MAMNESFDGKLEDNIRVKQHKITGFTSEDQERRTSWYINDDGWLIDYLCNWNTKRLDKK